MKNKLTLFFTLAMLLLATLPACKNSSKLTDTESKTIINSKRFVKEKWSMVENQYQRRCDLYKNLATSLKHFQEKENIEQLRQALQQMQEVADEAYTLSKVKIDLNNEQALKTFIDSQDKLKEKMKIANYMAYSAYPDLKTNSLYMNLLVQNEGTENRIRNAKNDFISAVKEYNFYINKFGKEKAEASGFKELPNYKGL